MLICELVLNLPCVLVERYQATKFAVFDIVLYIFDHPCQSTRESLDATFVIVCDQVSIHIISLRSTTVVIRGERLRCCRMDFNLERPTNPAAVSHGLGVDFLVYADTMFQW